MAGRAGPLLKRNRILIYKRFPAAQVCLPGISSLSQKEEIKIMGKYFGTDGFRGEANVNLTVEHAYKVGRFLGWYYGQRQKTADNRRALPRSHRKGYQTEQLHV